MSQPGTAAASSIRARFSEREPYEQGFASVFDKEIAPGLDALEAERHRLRRQRALRLPLGIVIGLVIAAAAAVFFSHNTVVMGIGVVVGIVAGFLVAGSATGKFRDKLRGLVMDPATRFLQVSYSRKAPKEFSVRPFAKRHVVGHHDSAKLHDYVAGEHKGRRYEMAGALLTREESRSNNDNDNDSRTVTVFEGVLLSIAWPEAGQCEVLVGRDYGKLLNKIAGLGKAHRVNFEDQEFERRYECYASDPDTARRLLNPIFLQSMLALGEGRKGQLPTAAFTEGNFLLALPLPRVALFEQGSLSRSVDSIEEDIHTLLRQLTMPRRVVEILQGARQPIL